MMNRDLKVAYLAGVMDSDGWFTIHKNAKQNVNPVYSPSIGVNQVDSQAIELAIELFGGKMSVIDYSKTKNRFSQKPMYNWRPSKKNLADILECLIPYLRIKQNQAIILYRLKVDIDFHSRTGGREKASLPEQTVEFREKLYQQFKALGPASVAETECVGSSKSDEKRQSELRGNTESFTEMMKHLESKANAD